MSDLLRSAMHARISKLPQMPPVGPDGDEDEEAADSLGSLPSMAPTSSKYAFFFLSSPPHPHYMKTDGVVYPDLV